MRAALRAARSRWGAPQRSREGQRGRGRHGASKTTIDDTQRFLIEQVCKAWVQAQPQILLRIGHAKRLPASWRKPIEAVLYQAA
ncbi:hypothetical protein AAHN93_06375 [Vandammella animalimorsus]|uniref:hypothetical protein n=1 Tax=Vandammella animalimorsus TaxID=2029117 RepID=UPI0031BAD4A2